MEANKTSNTRILIYAIIVLAVMNVATFFSIGYHLYKSNREGTNNQELILNTGSDRYFRDRMRFSPQQSEPFSEYSARFRQKASEVNLALIECRRQMLEEMNSEEPDSLRLAMLSDSIGSLHASLKHFTYNYYLDIKKISTPSQEDELNLIFREFFINDNYMGGRGQQGRQQSPGLRFRRLNSGVNE